MELSSRYALDELQGNDFSESVQLRFVSNISRSFMGRSCADVLSRRSALASRSSRRQRKNDGVSLFESSDPLSTSRESDNYRGGFDGGLEIGWYGEFTDSVFSKICDKLDFAKERADLGDALRSYVDIGGYVVKVSPMGIRQGRIKYKYVFEYHGIRFCIHANPLGDIQPVRCRVGAVALLRSDHVVIYKTIINMLFALGFRPERELVSRADLQIMLSGVSVSDVSAAIAGGRLVTLARGKIHFVGNLATGELESITARSSTAEVCIYDKVAEALHNNQPGYLESFISRYYPDGLPEVLTRFEFRLSGEALRSFGVYTFCDLVHHSRGLVQYYTSTWFRLLERRKVRGMGTRQRVSGVWSTVQRAFQFVFRSFGSLASVEKVRARRPLPNVSRLVRVALGCMARAVALTAENAASSLQENFKIFDFLVASETGYFVDKVCLVSSELHFKEGYYD